jgi:hypothetical protein
MKTNMLLIFIAEVKMTLTMSNDAVSKSIGS